MADPSAVADADGEWFEVHNRGSASVSLQGWTIAGNNDVSHIIVSAVSVPARGYVVLARNGSSGINGGVSAGYTYGTMTMANTSDWIALRDGGGASVDSVAAAGMKRGEAEGARARSSRDRDAVARRRSVGTLPGARLAGLSHLRRKRLLPSRAAVAA